MSKPLLAERQAGAKIRGRLCTPQEPDESAGREVAKALRLVSDVLKRADFILGVHWVKEDPVSLGIFFQLGEWARARDRDILCTQ